MGFSPVPPEIKPVAHLMKLAEEHDQRNIVVAYWARMAACRLAMKTVPGKKSPETTALLTEILDWLEKTKEQNRDNYGIRDEAAAQAIIEDYALNLFNHGDQQDRAEVYNKNTVKTFYTAGMLFDVLDQFGLSEDLQEKQKYAKWKAAYIHNCLKSGEQPIPGPPGGSNGEDKIVHISDLPEEEQEKALAERRRKMEEEEERKRQQAKNDGNELINWGDSSTPAFGPPTTDLNFPSSSGNGGFPYPSGPNNSSLAGPAGFIPPSVPSTPVAPVVLPTTPTPSYEPPSPSAYKPPQTADTGVQLTADQITKAQKYTKYAASALNYDDVKTAMDNLEKALHLLKFGKEQ